ncbi:SOS response-associated peptidase [Acidithiobacillus ferriphilus]|nr:hypothetical protein [Acidithiobacillus sp.]MBU2784182.1 SOS response-associated peptidase [Acidithiobacillus ferriphilus]MDA8246766.1 hypothetical protein [Acidithiobacillus sp.]
MLLSSVIRDVGAGPEWAMMRWGLIPHWAKPVSRVADDGLHPLPV